MPKGVQTYWRFMLPITLALLLLLVLTSQAFAAIATESSRSGDLKAHYLALGDSLAFGYQPNGDYKHGYVPDLFAELKGHGVRDVVDLGCPGETSATTINGGCPFAPKGSVPQLTTALAYLHVHAGQVGLVTFDIGANDLLHDSDVKTCTVNNAAFYADLTRLDNNLTHIILPRLYAALKVNGHRTGEIVMMNYYDPSQNICPKAVRFTKTLNKHLAQDVSGFGRIVNVFAAFGGAKTPNPNICALTWMCTAHPDIHATTAGYKVIADTFAEGIED